MTAPDRYKTMMISVHPQLTAQLSYSSVPPTGTLAHLVDNSVSENFPQVFASRSTNSLLALSSSVPQRRCIFTTDITTYTPCHQTRHSGRRNESRSPSALRYESLNQAAKQARKAKAGKQTAARPSRYTRHRAAARLAAHYATQDDPLPAGKRKISY